MERHNTGQEGSLLHPPVAVADGAFSRTSYVCCRTLPRPVLKGCGRNAEVIQKNPNRSCSGDLGLGRIVLGAYACLPAEMSARKRSMWLRIKLCGAKQLQLVFDLSVCTCKEP